MFPTSVERMERWRRAFSDQLLTHSSLLTVRDPVVSELVLEDPPETVASQFRFISCISNDPYGFYLMRNGKTSKSHHTLRQAILYQPREEVPFSFYEQDEPPPGPKHRPTSLRNRLLYDIVYPPSKTRRIYLDDLIVNYIRSTKHIPPNPNRTPLEHERTRRPVMLTAPDSVAGDAPNMATTPDLYELFKEQMIILGIVKFRSFFKGGCVLIMSSATDTGFVIPDKFEHVRVEFDSLGDIITCSCSLYAFLQGSTMLALEARAEEADIALSERRTCFHATLVYRELLKYCKDHTLLKADSTSDFLARLAISVNIANSHCMLIVRPIPRRTMKLSVKGLDDNPLAFVHISADRTTVSCQSGKCSGRMKASLGTETREEEFERQTQFITPKHDTSDRKKGERLTLEHWDHICAHLQTLANNREEWEGFLSDRFIPEKEFNVEDSNIPMRDTDCEFDQETKLWKNFALSQHKPHSADEVEQLAQ